MRGEAKPLGEKKMPNVEIHPFSRPSMWRKMSFGNWKNTTDPQVYGRLKVDIASTMEYARGETARTGVKITPTHLVIRGVALALREYPDANSLIRWNRVYQRKKVDIFCQVAIPGEKPDLSGTTIREVDKKRPFEIAQELREQSQAVRKAEDKEFVKTRKTLNLIPSGFSRYVLRFVAFLQYTLNLNLGFLGLPRDPFGGVMVTSIGSLGISEAYPPLVPMSRVPFMVSVGKVEDKPVVRDGQITIRPECVLTATFDHRIMDGLLIGKLAEFVTAYLSAPEEYEKRLDEER